MTLRTMTTTPTAITLRPYRATLDLVVGMNTSPPRRIIRDAMKTPVTFYSEGLNLEGDRPLPRLHRRQGHLPPRQAPAGPLKNRASAVQGGVGRRATGGLNLVHYGNGQRARCEDTFLAAPGPGSERPGVRDCEGRQAGGPARAAHT